MIALLDYHGIVAIAVIALTNDFTIAIAVTMAGSDGHANRTDTDTDFFRTGRHGDTNSSRGNGDYCKTFNHSILLGLSCALSQGQFTLD
jgi:hypothetical protein